MKETIENSLQESEIFYHTILDNEKQTIFKFMISLENGRYETIIELRKGTDQVLIYTNCPTKIPEQHRLNISEFLTRANFDLIIGNFEIDLSSGEIRYKNVFIYEPELPMSNRTFMRNLHVCFRTMDKYMPGLMTVVYGNTTPATAIKAIEEASEKKVN